MPSATLTINSRNYGAWSLRGWLMCRFAGLDFEVVERSAADPTQRDELLLMSPSFLVPCLSIDGLEIWDTLAIGEYLAETHPEAGLLPDDVGSRALCRSVSGEMHSGFASLRSAMPMNVKARHEDFKVFSGAQADIDRICEVWRHCLGRQDGPFLFGERPTMADAMFAPVCSRLTSYGVEVDPTCAAYVATVTGLAEYGEWVEGAHAEPDEIIELDAEF
ncbi:MAG TPA: glutathione S-transferase [Acidimicrobiales bacterium]